MYERWEPVRAGQDGTKAGGTTKLLRCHDDRPSSDFALRGARTFVQCVTVTGSTRCRCRCVWYQGGICVLVCYASTFFSAVSVYYIWSKHSFFQYSDQSADLAQRRRTKAHTPHSDVGCGMCTMLFVLRNTKTVDAPQRACVGASPTLHIRHPSQTPN